MKRFAPISDSLVLLIRYIDNYFTYNIIYDKNSVCILIKIRRAQYIAINNSVIRIDFEHNAITEYNSKVKNHVLHIEV